MFQLSIWAREKEVIPFVDDDLGFITVPTFATQALHCSIVGQSLPQYLFPKSIYLTLRLS